MEGVAVDGYLPHAEGLRVHDRRLDDFLGWEHSPGDSIRLVMPYVGPDFSCGIDRHVGEGLLALQVPLQLGEVLGRAEELHIRLLVHIPAHAAACSETSADAVYFVVILGRIVSHLLEDPLL